MSDASTAPVPSVDPAGGPSALIALLARCAQGDAGSLQALYDATASTVYGLAVRITGNKEDAEEVVLDVYLKAWQGAAQYDAKRGSVLAWLLVMARTGSIDRLRRRQSRIPSAVAAEREEPASLDTGPEQAAWLSQRRGIVRRALDALPAEQRLVIALAYFEGLSQSELAARLGQPLGTVKTRMRLALSKLRGALGEEVAE